MRGTQEGKLAGLEGWMWGTVVGGQGQSLCVRLGGPILQELEQRGETALEENSELGVGLLGEEPRSLPLPRGETGEARAALCLASHLLPVQQTGIEAQETRKPGSLEWEGESKANPSSRAAQESLLRQLW